MRDCGEGGQRTRRIPTATWGLGARPSVFVPIGPKGNSGALEAAAPSGTHHLDKRSTHMNPRRALAATALLSPLAAHASFLSGDALDSAANALSWVIIFLVPAIGIAVFWIVHILPEKIAEQRHHPQKDSIKVLCILSLFFGGMLWPIAWLWAYTRPSVHRAVYGTDKHDDYYLELGDLAMAG